ncbi:HU family DNA-binding protein [Massilia sp. H-1]|nr:HU family DNA-binding protein [Massilia sp. H-1]
MNKTELIESIAKSADISKASATRALDAVLEAVTTSLRNNDSVTLVGFGTFSVGSARARASIHAPRKPSRSPQRKFPNLKLAKRSKMQ